MHVFTDVSSFIGAIGQTLGTSEWYEIDQGRVERFGHATDDLQWIHMDPERAHESPFGTTIAHGYLVLSLLVPLMDQTYSVENRKMGVNYGLNKVRFPSPTPVGSRIRVTSVLTAAEVVSGGVQTVMTATVQREGSEKPVCVAETVTRHYF